MRFTVVVPTFNRSASLRPCLAAICRQDYPDYEVIVVDDASTDETPDIVAADFPQVRLLQQPTNRGPAAARNRGIQLATGDGVAFTDDDCLVPTDWLNRLADGFDRYPDAAGVGGYQEAPPGLIATNVTARADSLRRLRRWGDQVGREQLGGYEIPGLATNNVAYRRQVLLAVGGFDEGFPLAAGEDADLKLRVAQAGYPLLYLPLGVEHYREYTWHAQWRLAHRRGQGVYHFETKHGQAPTIGRIALRLARRTLNFPLNTLRMGPGVAAVLLVGEVSEVFGQLRMALAGPSPPG